MWQGIDQRKFPRANYPCKVAVFLKGHREKFSTHTENIGQGGICVILENGLDKFSMVEIILYLEKDRPAIECDGRIVWVIKREKEFDTGIEFLNIRNEDALRIERIVQECLKKNQDSLPRSQA